MEANWYSKCRTSPIKNAGAIRMHTVSQCQPTKINAQIRKKRSGEKDQEEKIRRGRSGRKDQYGQAGLLQDSFEQVGHKEHLKDTPLMNREGEQVRAGGFCKIPDPLTDVHIVYE